MTQHQFTDDRLAGLYDRFYPPERRADFARTDIDENLGRHARTCSCAAARTVHPFIRNNSPVSNSGNPTIPE